MTDELYPDAVRLARDAGMITTSHLQRELRIGYARAVALIDLMESAGVVGPADGLKPREVIKPDSSPQKDLFA